MKEQIDKLVELAKEYADLHRKTSFEPERVYYRGEIWSKDEISVNADVNYVSVNFGNIEVDMGTITIPVKSTEKSLEKVYNDAKNFLSSIDVKELEKKKREQQKKRSRELKKELAKLKGV